MRLPTAKRWWAPWFVLVVGLISTCFVAIQLWRASDARDSEHFRRSVDDVCSRIEGKFHSYVTVLQSTVGLFSAAGNVDQEQFRRFVVGFGAGGLWEGVDGIGVSMRVNEPRANSAQSFLAADGPTDLQIWPESERNELHVVAFMQPANPRNEALKGFDFYSEPGLMSAMARARDSGQAAMSRAIEMPLPEDVANGEARFVIFVPIYENEQVPPTVAARREQLRGYAFAPLRVPGLFQKILPAVYRPPLYFGVYDGAPGSGAEHLYSSRPSKEVAHPWLRNKLSAARQLDVGGQLWRLAFVSSPAFEYSSSLAYLPYVITIGLCVTILLFAISWSQVRERNAAESVAAQLNAVIESMPDAVYIASSRGIVTSNRRGLSIWGVQNLDDLKKRFGPMNERASLRDSDTGEVIPLAQRPLARALQGEVVIRDVVISQPNSSEQLYYRTAAAPIRRDGQISGAVSIMSDTTDRTRAEAALRRSENQFRDLADAMPQIVWTCRPDGTHDYFNSRWYEYTGARKPSVTEHDWIQYIHGDDEEPCRRHWRHCLETGEAYHIEYRIRNAVGAYRWHLGRALPIQGDDGEIVRWYGTCTDIHDHKLAEEALHRLNETLEERVAERTAVAEKRTAQLHLLASELTLAEQRERRRIAQVLHDELQQLLFAVRMRLSRLRGNLTQQEFDDNLEHAGALLSQVIQSMRSLSVELSPPVLQDRGLPSAFEWLARRMYEEHGLDVKLQVNGEIEPVAEHASLFLVQAGRELLFNIVKHAGVENATVELTRLDDGQVELAVSDEGDGFDPGQLAKSGASPERFGLFNVQQRIELMGGHCEVESRPNRGSRVVITLPAEPETETGESKTLAAEILATNHADSHAGNGNDRETGARPIRVLLVDDHKIVREGLAGLLEEEQDIELVGEASDGQMAMDMARQLKPDVIVMDVSMPRMNGIEATRLITAEMPGVRIIGLSMHEKEDMATAMREAGAQAYLAKDGPSDVLVAAIRDE